VEGPGLESDRVRRGISLEGIPVNVIRHAEPLMQARPQAFTLGFRDRSPEGQRRYVIQGMGRQLINKG
jgi:hypothetical protein